MDAYIVEAVKTPRTKVMKGGLAAVKPLDLIAALSAALAERCPGLSDAASSLILGCVGALGPQGSNIAHTACLYSKHLGKAYGTTVNSFCASGLEAVYQAAAKAALGEEVVLAGGVESLSQVPMFSDQGAWFTDLEVAAQTRYISMGVAADLLAALRGYSRIQLDAFGIASQRRAAQAQRKSSFVAIVGQDGRVIDRDEAILPDCDEALMASKAPRFLPSAAEAERLLAYGKLVQPLHHSLTSPALVDGAGLMVLANASGLKRHGWRAQARILGCAGASSDPVVMLTGHIAAAQTLLQRFSLRPSDLEAVEVNESFAASALAFAEDLGLDLAQMNQRGGAIARGHPLGATGAILIEELIGTLNPGGLGLAAIPGGGGLGIAVLIERL